MGMQQKTMTFPNHNEWLAAVAFFGLYYDKDETNEYPTDVARNPHNGECFGVYDTETDHNYLWIGEH